MQVCNPQEICQAHSQFPPHSRVSLEKTSSLKRLRRRRFFRKLSKILKFRFVWNFDFKLCVVGGKIGKFWLQIFQATTQDMLHITMLPQPQVPHSLRIDINQLWILCSFTICTMLGWFLACACLLTYSVVRYIFLPDLDADFIFQ